MSQLLKNAPATPLPWDLKWEERSSRGTGERYSSAWIAFQHTGKPGTMAEVAEHVEVHGKAHAANAAYLAHAASAYPELVRALRSAQHRLRCISAFMEDQVDQKVVGSRKNYSYKSAALQMNEEAIAEAADAAKALERVGEEVIK